MCSESKGWGWWGAEGVRGGQAGAGSEEERESVEKGGGGGGGELSSFYDVTFHNAALTWLYCNVHVHGSTCKPTKPS